MTKSKAQSSTTLAIVDQYGNSPRKITKIVPYKNGGFAVLVPYHTARKGHLLKSTIDYTKRRSNVSPSESNTYSADDRVKLSFHKDGFVQFSGEQPGKIISGRDPLSGDPKGLGILLENPLYSPIMSGPTFVISVWGLSEFEEIKATPNKDTLIFSEDDFYYRECTPDSWNAYSMEAFIFSKDYWSGIRSQSGRFKLSLGFNAFQASGAVIDFTIIPIGQQPILLGLMVSRFQHSFPSQSGFSFSSPSDRKHGEPLASSLMAIYPDFINDKSTQTINYQVSDEVSRDT